MQILMPPGAAAVLALLERAGYAAYVVGGCVRDKIGRASCRERV